MDKTNLYINSRGLGTASNFAMVLTPIKVNSITYIGSEIPFSFYTTNANNNQLRFRVGATIYVANITPGSYEITTYVSALQSAMNAVFAGFTITYSRITYKITITNAAAFTVLAASSCSRQLGITADATGTTYVSGVVDIAGPRYLFIRSSVLTAQKIIKNYVNSNLSDVIAKISVNVAPGDIIVDKSVQSIMYRTPQILSTININITDEFGAAVDLNGLDASISLQIN